MYSVDQFSVKINEKILEMCKNVSWKNDFSITAHKV